MPPPPAASDAPDRPGPRPWQARTFRVVFEADTRSGKAFDVALIAVIAVSVLAVMLESVAAVRARWGPALRGLEWGITALFTVEYAVRLACVARPRRYATSFFGVIDLLAVLPTYLSVLLPGSQSLLVIRALRLLRVLRVFKLGTYLGQANLLLTALRASRRKVVVFLLTVLILNLILGSLLYLVEGEASGFTSIPRAMYWAIVTMTTVGYGDIAPVTVPGQLLAAAAMLLGYAIIAVPTGIVTAEIVGAHRPLVSARRCPACHSDGHAWDARFCRDCGAALAPPTPAAEAEPEPADAAAEPDGDPQGAGR